MKLSVPGWAVFAALLSLVVVTALVLPPHVSSDSTSYLKTMNVLLTGDAPPGFIPNRILTTFLGLETVVVAGIFLGDILAGWYLVNAILFIIGLAAFFAFLRDFFEDDISASIGTLMLATNYVVISFGLNYLMDMGGWAFYLLALWAGYRYYKKGNGSYLLWGAFFIGMGGLWKEYAFLAAIPLLGALFLRERKRPLVFVPRFIQAVLLSSLPIIVLYFFVYTGYGYTYANWLGFNQDHYGASYLSRIVEYVKVFGSLFTFGWFLALPGLYLVLRKGEQILGLERLWFLALVFISGLPIFLWPAITQRVFFVSVVFLVLLATLALKYYERYLSYLLPLVLLYVIAGYAMDGIILPWVNIGAFF